MFAIQLRPSFLSTLSLRRATCTLACPVQVNRHFYPRSPCGERHYLLQAVSRPYYFYPRSPCGERPRERASIKPIFRISIHALLAESDLGNAVAELPTWKFLSTLSLRRATVNGGALLSCSVNFYPRSPCGERLENALRQIVNRRISIHALLAESDSHLSMCNTPLEYFYPRSPCGERPLAPEENPTQKRISIHALLAESDDTYTRTQSQSLSDFYPRSPCGERRLSRPAD